MGKPSKGTPKDQRLKENQSRASAAPGRMKAPGQLKAPGTSARSLAPGAKAPGTPPSTPQVLRSASAPRPAPKSKAARPTTPPAADQAMFTLRPMPRKGG